MLQLKDLFNITIIMENIDSNLIEELNSESLAKRAGAVENLFNQVNSGEIDTTSAANLINKVLISNKPLQIKSAESDNNNYDNSDEQDNWDQNYPVEETNQDDYLNEAEGIAEDFSTDEINEAAIEPKETENNSDQSSNNQKQKDIFEDQVTNINPDLQTNEIDQSQNQKSNTNVQKAVAPTTNNQNPASAVNPAPTTPQNQVNQAPAVAPNNVPNNQGVNINNQNTNTNNSPATNPAPINNTQTNQNNPFEQIQM